MKRNFGKKVKTGLKFISELEPDIGHQNFQIDSFGNLHLNSCVCHVFTSSCSVLCVGYQQSCNLRVCVCISWNLERLFIQDFSSLLIFIDWIKMLLWPFLVWPGVNSQPFNLRFRLVLCCFLWLCCGLVIVVFGGFSLPLLCVFVCFNGLKKSPIRMPWKPGKKIRALSHQKQ